MDKERWIVTEINGQAKGNKASVVLSSTEGNIEESIGMNHNFQDLAKRTRENLDKSSNSDEEPRISRRYFQRFRKREEELKLQILQLKYELACNAAVSYQYGTNVKQMQAMAIAAIDREGCTIGNANAQYERGDISGGEVESDEEDKKVQKTVKYTYIDNKSFQNKELNANYGLIY